MDTQRLNRNDWTRFVYGMPVPGKKKVKAVTFNLKAKHKKGDVRLTDIQLQGGGIVTGQTPHTSELLMPLTYGINERENIDSVSGAKKKGVQPKPTNYFKALDQRMFNIVGRGHETIALPNIFQEDYTLELLTSGLELELYAKDDFDLVRISTNDGALMEGRRYSADGPLATHPLNYKYTREFYGTGGKAGEKISLSCELNKAQIGSKEIKIGQRAPLQIGEEPDYSRQRLMVAPYGSFRLRIEFYKEVEENITDSYGETKKYKYLKDVGIGFYGTARFQHIKGNHKF